MIRSIVAAFSGSQPASWFGHACFTLAVAFVFGLLAALASLFTEAVWPPSTVYAVTACAMAVWYTGRESLHLFRYWRRGELRKADEDGINKAIDGIGDVIGPVVAAASALLCMVLAWM